MAGDPPAVPARENRPDAAVCDDEEEGEELFDSARGVVDVNRVASETDRGPVVLIAIVSFVVADTVVSVWSLILVFARQGIGRGTK